MEVNIINDAALNVSISLKSPGSNDLATREGSTIYFGYGSNLWRNQMQRRCPNAKFLGIARLKGYRWIIYDRGYANIVQISTPVASVQGPMSNLLSDQTGGHDYTREVWGFVYRLQSADEAQLDRNEGVPIAYQKEIIDEIDFWPSPASLDRPPSERLSMLVYINRDQVQLQKPKDEYIGRMNLAIQDALEEGIPKAYIQQSLRPFIPEGESHIAC